MRAVTFLLSGLMLVSSLLVAKMALSAEAPAAAPATGNSAASNKSTNISFDELLIQGKYHFSDEAVVTVEQDKVLDALLGVRKDFKDRLQQSVERQ